MRAWPRIPEQREHDVVVYGATGFVGKLTAEYLAEHGARRRRGSRSAAARTEKLERTRAELGGRAADWPLVVADSSDEAAVAALAASTRAVATTVGPYAKYGMPLLARVRAPPARHYADLTGEMLFMRRAIDTHHETAKAQRRADRPRLRLRLDPVGPRRARAARARERATASASSGTRRYVVVGLKGGASGGTVDSLRGQIDEAKRDPAVRRIAGRPVRAQPGPRGGAGPRPRA